MLLGVSRGRETMSTMNPVETIENGKREDERIWSRRSVLKHFQIQHNNSWEFQRPLCNLRSSIQQQHRNANNIIPNLVQTGYPRESTARRRRSSYIYIYRERERERELLYRILGALHLHPHFYISSHPVPSHVDDMRSN